MVLYNLTNMTNASSVLQIIKEVDSDGWTTGFFMLFALLGFFVVTMTHYDYKGVKEVFVLTSFLTANLIGLFFLAGLVSIFYLIMGLVLLVISILVYFFYGD